RRSGSTRNRPESSCETFPRKPCGAIMLAPPTARPVVGDFRSTPRRKLSSEGVDGDKKRCRMGGSPGTKGLQGCHRKRWRAKRSLTVCAGELCGRLALEGYDLSKQCKRPTK